MSDSSYTTDRAWERYQPFLPAHLRCEGDRIPVEERWTWKHRDVHLDRHVAPDAPLKVIALHGAAGHGRLLASIGIALKGEAEIVAPDLPGYGQTTPHDSFTYGEWVRCTVDLIAAERRRDGRPVVLFGASVGGMLAYDAAAISGDVIGIIATCLIDPTRHDVRRAVVRHPALVPLIPAVMAVAAAAPRLRVPTRVLANVKAVANPPGLAAACLADRRGAGNAAPLGFLRSWLNSQRPLPPEQFDVCPVMLTHPGDDRWTPATLSCAFLDRLSRVPTTYVELDNCGHFPVEEPGVSVMADKARAFLRTLADSPMHQHSASNPGLRGRR